ncbi:MAG: LysM peptidoglycan-binding domain-containing protein, partial [Rubrivivax sp.]
MTERQREAAERVAQGGVALADLAPDAPQRHTVQPGDTLWGLARLFLKSPWRWPELWGMNLEQVRNPHRIFPGQTLLLLQEGGRARLVLASARGAGSAGGAAGPGAVAASPEEVAAALPTVPWPPRVRGEPLSALPISAVSVRMLAPFLTETVVLETDELVRAPRIVGARDGRLLLSQGETAYVLGDLGGAEDFRVFRAPVALRDPATGELLGYEARYVGRARALRAAAPAPAPAPVGAGAAGAAG